MRRITKLIERPFHHVRWSECRSFLLLSLLALAVWGVSTAAMQQPF